jgi:uncharacterized protein
MCRPGRIFAGGMQEDTPIKTIPDGDRLPMKSPEVQSAADVDTGSPRRPGNRIKWIFTGPQGLRAGWRIALYWLIFAAVLAPGLWLFKRWAGATPASMKSLTPGFLLLAESVPIAAMAVATCAIAAVERQSPLAYGLRDRAAAKRLAYGIASGFTAISVLVALLWSTGFLHLSAAGSHGAAALKDGLVWALAFLAVALFEELTLRGYFQFALARKLGFWWATLLTSLLFGAIHGINPGETAVGLFMAMAFGFIACLSLWYTGSLWWVIGCHVGWDWGQSFVYGVRDSGLPSQGALLAAQPAGNVWLSGGNTGPEGSLFVMPVLIVMTALIWLSWRRKGSAFVRQQTR